MAAWPVILPQYPLTGFTVTSTPAVVRSEMDVGIAKVRRRATYSTIRVEGDFMCSQAQVEAMELFFRETTRAGTLWFTMNASHTDKLMEARFLDPPEFTWIGGRYFQARCRLEMADTLLFVDNAIWHDGDNWIWPDGDNAIWP